VTTAEFRRNMIHRSSIVQFLLLTVARKSPF
jgi:hypothetical protein